MMSQVSRAKWALVVGWLLGCSEPAKAPPPLPVARTATLADAATLPVGREAPAAKATEPRPSAAPRPRSAAKPATPSVKQAPARAPATPRPTSAEPAPAPVAQVAPPAPAAAAAAPVRAKSVLVPRTANVHVELPGGLQSDLDADPRMQKWVDRVVQVADGCHAKNRAAQGVVEAVLTMHENERPSADLRPVPGSLSPVVTCATFALMQVKMPLFTGREGTRYNVRVVFDPS